MVIRRVVRGWWDWLYESVTSNFSPLPVFANFYVCFFVKIFFS